MISQLTPTTVASPRTSIRLYCRILLCPHIALCLLVVVVDIYLLSRTLISIVLCTRVRTYKGARIGLAYINPSDST